jgi:hypothetical protein
MFESPMLILVVFFKKRSYIQIHAFRIGLNYPLINKFMCTMKNNDISGSHSVQFTNKKSFVKQRKILTSPVWREASL